jgi:hypothetical protein
MMVAAVSARNNPQAIKILVRIFNAQPTLCWFFLSFHTRVHFSYRRVLGKIKGFFNQFSFLKRKETTDTPERGGAGYPVTGLVDVR